MNHNTLRKHLFAIIISFSLSFPLGTLQARDTQWKLDKGQSSLTFKVKSFLTNVSGSFRKFEVSKLSAKKGNISGLLKIHVASLDTKNKKRDGHLRNQDFFDVRKFPTAEIHVKRYDITEGTGKAAVILKIKGVSKKILIPVKLEKKLKYLFFSGKFFINRKDFKVDYDSRLNPIKDKVELRFKIVLVK